MTRERSGVRVTKGLVQVRQLVSGEAWLPMSAGTQGLSLHFQAMNLQGWGHRSGPPSPPVQEGGKLSIEKLKAIIKL